MTSEYRAVWLDGGTIVAINQALIDADQRGVNERALTWNLGAIVAAWDAAPADATEAVHDTLYRQHLGGVWRGDESALVAAAILAALGCAPPTTKDTT